jgi:hypothetical protein
LPAPTDHFTPRDGLPRANGRGANFLGEAKTLKSAALKDQTEMEKKMNEGGNRGNGLKDGRLPWVINVFNATDPLITPRTRKFIELARTILIKINI